MTKQFDRECDRKNTASALCVRPAASSRDAAAFPLH